MIPRWRAHQEKVSTGTSSYYTIECVGLLIPLAFHIKKKSRNCLLLVKPKHYTITIFKNARLQTRTNDMTKVKSILKNGEAPSRSVEALDLCWGNLEIYTFPVSPARWSSFRTRSFSASTHSRLYFETQNILGDNPAVTSGAPIAIDWRHQSKEIVGVEQYEYLRRSRPKRTRKALVMSGAERDT